MEQLFIYLKVLTIVTKKYILNRHQILLTMDYFREDHLIEPTKEKKKIPFFADWAPHMIA
jgi:hypothetical protein